MPLHVLCLELFASDLASSKSIYSCYRMEAISFLLGLCFVFKDARSPCSLNQKPRLIPLTRSCDSMPSPCCPRSYLSPDSRCRCRFSSRPSLTRLLRLMSTIPTRSRPSSRRSRTRRAFPRTSSASSSRASSSTTAAPLPTTTSRKSPRFTSYFVCAVDTRSKRAAPRTRALRPAFAPFL